MKARVLIAGIALVGTLVASLMGVAPRVVHAASTAPAVTANALPSCPGFSAEIDGTGFTPGGAVHIDLEFGGDWQGAFYEVYGSTDIVAARTTYVPNGHGIVFTRVGGYFNATVSSPEYIYGEFSFYVVATDEATGRTVSSLPNTKGCF